MALLEAIASLSIAQQEQQGRQQNQQARKMLSFISKFFKGKGKSQEQKLPDLPQEWFILHALPDSLYWDSQWVKQSVVRDRKSHLATALELAGIPGIDHHTAQGLAQAILSFCPEFDLNSVKFWQIRKLLELRMHLNLKQMVVC
ncbi:MAG: hypothetical protein F6K21_03090 [Symploca sp. SIO2D2]|nr:hypothetical protein [Symploca sp. SIO2D2]